MANSLYALGREAFLEGLIAALSDTLALSLVTTSYTPNLATDEFYSAISGGAVTAGPVTLTSVTGSAGTLSAANVSFSSVSGSTSSYLVLFKNTGTGSTSRLIGLIDTASGLPVTPNGGTIVVAWASGQVFTLFEGLSENERRFGYGQRLRDWMRDVCKIPAVLAPGGLWIPKPQILVAQPRVILA
jgi:hypothetical protein